MKPTVKIKGPDALEEKLKRLGSAFNKRRRAEINREAAGIILTEMQALVPKRTGQLQGDLTIADSADGLSVVIGPGGKTRWRAHFLEFGTIYMPADPFIRPAFDNSRDEVTGVVAKQLRSDILDIAKG